MVWSALNAFTCRLHSDCGETDGTIHSNDWILTRRQRQYTKKKKKKERKKETEAEGYHFVPFLPIKGSRKKTNKSYCHSTWNRNGHDPENPYCTGRDITEYGHSVRLSIHPHSKTGTNSVVWRPPQKKAEYWSVYFHPPTKIALIISLMLWDYQ